MKYVVPLSGSELISLRHMHEYHGSRRVRMRALAIILSHERYPIQQIADIFEVRRQTISCWIDAWERRGLAGLCDEPRSGHPLILDADDEEFIRSCINDEPRSSKRVLALLEEKRGKKVSESTIRRAIKKGRLRWKRVRKSLKPKQDEHKFQRAKQRNEALETRRLQGEVDLFYFDGSGFSLAPVVPYAWQPTGEYVQVPACTTTRSRLNVLAFMNKDNALIPFIFKGAVDGNTVAAFFESFSKGLEKKTFVILDNAPVHRSRAFIAHLPKWAKRGLIVKFLPPYSPELNLIEILWKKIKYEWLPLSAYLSFKSLQEAVENILRRFGSDYVIKFAA